MPVRARTSWGSFALLVALAPGAAHAQSEGWCAGFHLSDLDDRVHALTAFDSGAGPRLVAVGEFRCAGPQVVDHVAAWDGLQWSALGGGLPWDPGVLLCATACDDGAGPALFAGGRFAGPDGIPRADVARWDGSAWAALGLGGTGPGASVEALAGFDDGGGPALYAAGSFLTAGGQPALRVARWDGASWSALGGGLDGTATALAAHDDGSGPALYVGGSFTSAGGLAAPGLARWDGAWSSLPVAFVGSIAALTSFDDGTGPALYAAGSFAPPGGGLHRLGVARWRQGTWAFVAEFSHASGPRVLASFDDGHGGGLELFGAGSNWDSGAVWRRRESRMVTIAATEPFDPSDLDALAVVDLGSGPRLFAGGWFTGMHAFNPEQRAVPALNVAAWDGSTWSRMGAGGQGVDAWVATLASLDAGPTTSGRLAVLGGLTLAGDLPVQGAAVWDGSAWEVLADGSAGIEAVIEDPTTPGGDAFYAVVSGEVRRWDGQAWAVLAGLSGSIERFAFLDAVGGPQLVAGGSLDVPGAPPGQAVALWDGTSWLPLGLQGDASALVPWSPVRGAPARLVVAGSLGAPVNGPGVAQLEGGVWTTLGGGLVQGTPRALASTQESAGAALYLGGSFSAVAGVPARSIARWDGSAWSALDGGVAGVVQALAVRRTGGRSELFVGGDFALAGGLPAHNIARWDGASWSGLGPATAPGTNGRIQALAVVGRAVFAGGLFTQAGGAPSAHLACWSP